MMEFYPGLKGDSIIFCLAVINRNCMKQSVYQNIRKFTQLHFKMFICLTCLPASAGSYTNEKQEKNHLIFQLKMRKKY